MVLIQARHRGSVPLSRKLRVALRPDVVELARSLRRKDAGPPAFAKAASGHLPESHEGKRQCPKS
jgi:hypothetical protein